MLILLVTCKIVSILSHATIIDSCRQRLYNSKSIENVQSEAINKHHGIQRAPPSSQCTNYKLHKDTRAQRDRW
jgi:hypothetical protein